MKKRNKVSNKVSSGTVLCVFFLGIAVGRMSFGFPAVGTTTKNEQQASASSSTSLQQNEGEKEWKNLQVFRGIRRDPWPPLITEFPSQAGQDRIVANLLMADSANISTGFFVDLAANDAYRISNTYALERKFGWNGICIEANPQYWERLIQHRDCQVVAAAVSGERMKAVAFRYGGAFGGMIGKDLDNKETGGQGPAKGAPETTLYTVTLNEILQRFHAPHVMEYLSLDVEGAELMVIQNFSFDQYKFKLLTVERPNPTLVDLFRRMGYRFVKKLAVFGDLLFAHESALPHLNLAYVNITKKWRLVDRNDDGSPVTENSWEVLEVG